MFVYERSAYGDVFMCVALVMCDGYSVMLYRLYFVIDVVLRWHVMLCCSVV